MVPKRKIYSYILVFFKNTKVLAVATFFNVQSLSNLIVSCFIVGALQNSSIKLEFFDIQYKVRSKQFCQEQNQQQMFMIYHTFG